MTTQRRSPSGQGPSRRPGSSRAHTTGPVRNTGNIRRGGGSSDAGRDSSKRDPEPTDKSRKNRQIGKSAKDGDKSGETRRGGAGGDGGRAGSRSGSGASDGFRGGATRSGAGRTGNGRAGGPTRSVKRTALNRPAASRRTGNAGRGATKRTVAPRPRALTGRATVLIVIFVALALAYTYPLRVYLAQESQIAQLEADQAEQRELIAQKAQELQKWQDPEYIRAQAREILFYVRSGETPLLVFTDPAGAAAEAGQKAPAAAPDRWYDTLWSSVRAADAESPD
ncbi:FtsB family cell division protein [Paractinoplanes brasiliensis]|uniref:Cell division protein FtsB n=1 Tax=Paractinoplanes brasiliensis TaxID=52695 RepID=A0A4R6JRJ4_9ACTN|nr:septum formation initiator family protein [Actinoplanes brasiliensis]TDO38647.1 cell division protein FtsB [Actinoplanes brasiliensis]GID26576.1 hypothetical protein Abr02nite_15590 [Actinoplanes brasiliensis]